MPVNGVPEPSKPVEEKPAVQIIEQTPAAPVAAAPVPEAPKLASVNIEAINRQAAQQQQAAKVVPQRKCLTKRELHVSADFSFRKRVIQTLSKKSISKIKLSMITSLLLIQLSYNNSHSQCLSSLPSNHFIIHRNNS